MTNSFLWRNRRRLKDKSRKRWSVSERSKIVQPRKLEQLSEVAKQGKRLQKSRLRKKRRRYRKKRRRYGRRRRSRITLTVLRESRNRRKRRR